MATNGVNGNGNGVEANGVSGWKHYNEGTFLFTVSLPRTKEPTLALTALFAVRVRR